MGFRKWFGKEKEPEPDYSDLTLDLMEPGFMVDHDLQTWTVTCCGTYDYEGYLTREWELHAGDQVRFLERAEEDGKVEWTLTRRISVRDIDEDVVGAIQTREDPPDTLHFEGQVYTAVESSAGIYRPDSEDEDDEGEEDEREFVTWNFEGNEERLLSVLQWSDTEFAAYVGSYVEDFHFHDILPAAGGQLD